MADPIPFPGHRVNRPRKEELDQVERNWHAANLALLRSQADLDCRDCWHFSLRAQEYGITDEEIRSLRFQGSLQGIEVGSDDKGIVALPKYILWWTCADGMVIEGVFATNGRCLRGVTLIRRGSELACALRKAA